MAQDLVRLIVLDDHELVGYALARALDAADEPHELHLTTEPDRAVSLAASSGDAIVVLERRVNGDIDGLDLLATLRRRAPGARVVFLSSSYDDNSLRRILSGGASGCLLKSQPVDELVESICSVARGQVVVAGELIQRVVQLGRPASGSEQALSPREIEVLQLLAYGASTEQIAEQLYISINTVRNHIRRVIQKLQVHSRLEAAAHGIRNGLVEGP